MKDFFKGWHKPTVCTVVVIVVALLVVHHLWMMKKISGVSQ